MTMPGGGHWKVGPGQITDDSEISMCLLWSIVEENKDKSQSPCLNNQQIAKFYGEWIKSDPFDIG